MWHVELSKSKMLGNADAIDGFELEREDFELDDVNDEDDELEKLEKFILDAAPPSERWYHGRLDRSDAELRLHAQSLPFSYLVRESTSKLGIYSLSYMNKALMISHFRITAICGDYYIGGRKFQSLHHLIGYYSTYGSLMKNEKLEQPIPPPEPVHLAHRVVAIFPYSATTDTDELSFNIGDVFSVKNHLDSDWLWVVAQKDNKSGLVPKALTEEMDSSADPYEGQSWFCAVNRDEAQTILMNYGNVGNFLIRPSDNQGDYSISLRDHSGVSRYLIRRQGRHFYIGGRTFETIEDIIRHYSKEQLAEGVSLKEPLDRAKYEVFYKSLHSSSRSKASVRSTGHSVPFITPRRLDSRGSDRFGITKSGFLIKRGGRNKWRRLYMILKGDEQQLLYFENEKRAKPKGLFDLTFASVYKVHESLFGRANCLQVVVRALDETQTYFICAETSDAAQDWFECITKYCGKMRNQSQNKKAVKELRSLELTVCHAQKIPVNKLPHPYCIISLNDIKTCKTKAKEAPEPVFDEEFKFDDLPSDISSFTVALYNRKAAPYKDKEMGRVTIYLNTLEPGKVLDQWFTLGSLQHKSEMGSIRLTAKFVHEIIMPIDEYSKLQELLLNKDYQLVQTLGEVSKDLNLLAYTLLRIFRQNESELHLIRTITLRELNDKEKKETLFRGNSLATKLMDQYMKLTAIPYLQKTIKGVITKIMESKQCCELNPARVEKGSNVAENLQQLIKFLEEITSNIFNSVHSCPKSLRYLFSCLQQEATKLWPGDDSVRQRVVSAFLFLRLIVPGILYPKMHNLINESPSAMSSRTLTLVASCLQKLANLVEFGAKEPYLAVVNPFLQKYREKMIDFLDEISNQSEIPSTQESFNHDLARDLANIHETCVRHEHQLSNLCAQQPSIRILMVIVDHIRKTKEQYLAQSESICDEFAV